MPEIPYSASVAPDGVSLSLTNYRHSNRQKSLALPGVRASPLDLFETAFWCGDDGKSLPPVKADGGVDSGEPDFRGVDDRPKLEMNSEKIIFLLRSALLDDATNISQRFGTLQAQISVDDENDVWIALEEDLWPEGKEPVQPLIVAAQLGIEIELETMWSKILFHWPGILVSVSHCGGSSRIAPRRTRHAPFHYTPGSS